MRILIFLFLSTSCLIYYGNAAGNTKQTGIVFVDNPILGDATVRQKRQIPGGEMPQDPNDPKYQQMAEDLVRNNLRIKEEDIDKIKVNRVTTQIVAGTLTRIKIGIILVSGISDQCDFEVWQQIFVKHVSYKCLALGNKKVLIGISGTPRPAQIRDPKDPKYQKLAKASIDSWFETDDNKPFKKEDIETIDVTSVKVEIGSKIMNVIQFNVKTNNSNYQCNSIIMEKPWNPEETSTISSIKCTANKATKLFLAGSLMKASKPVPGGETDKDPYDPKYQQLAKESFQKFQDSHSNIHVHLKRIKIDKVTSQVVAGTIIRIHFHAYLTRGSPFECESKIFEALGPNRKLDFDVNCTHYPGSETEEDPDDPKYQQLAKESFQKYQDSHSNEQIHVKRIKVDSVTSQLVAGTIIRIYFHAYLTRGSPFMCESEIFEALGPKPKLDFNVNCTHYPGSETEEDPDDPKYQQLAEESFQKYQDSHTNEHIHVKRIKVDRVTSQLVAGTIFRIHFHVYPTRGSILMCQSKIFKALGPKPKLGFDVSCDHIDGGEEERDPDDPQFRPLAKESFRQYRETHFGPLFVIKELKVTRATTQVVAGVITRLDFEVIIVEGGKYVCHSKIFEQSWKQIKNINVSCSFVSKGDNVRLSIKMSPMSKTANVANEAVKQYLKTKNDDIYFERIETKSIKTVNTRVSKQKITYYEVDAFIRNMEGDFSYYNCSVVTGSWFGKKPFATNCIKMNFLMGRREWVDPTNKKYLSFAEKLLQIYLKNLSKNRPGSRDYKKYDIIVTYVQRGLVAGWHDDIKYIARWVHGNEEDPAVLLCSGNIWEKVDGTNDINGHCASVSWNRDK